MCKLFDYIKDNGLNNFIILISLLLFKKINNYYQGRPFPYLLKIVIFLLARLTESYKKLRGKEKVFSLPGMSSDDLNELDDNYKIEVVRHCDLLLANKLTPGFEYEIDLTMKDFWRLDPLTKVVYPLSVDHSFFSSNLGQHKGDVRLLWEINRMQFLVLLAQGYVLTENKAYSEKVYEIVETWVEQNPTDKGVNWLDAQDVGIRMVSMLLCRSILQENGVIDSRLDDWDSLIKEHAYFVFRHVSISRVTHNHLMTELVSLFVFSAMVKDNQYKYLLLYLSRFLLRREIRNQINDDGISAEGSTNYTLFVYDAILFGYHINKKMFKADLIDQEMLGNMAQVIEQFTVNNVDIVKIGDADNGKYIRLDWMSDLSRKGFVSLIKNSFLGESTQDSIPTGTEHFWLEPAEYAVKNKHGLQDNLDSKPVPVVYKTSGYLSYIVNDQHLYLRFGPSEINNNVNSGHTHSDFLSFSLYRDGVPIFLDPGTYTYLGKDSERNSLRSALMHNTVTLDDDEFVDINKTVFGIPELKTVETGKLHQEGSYYVICASFINSRSEILKRIFIFDQGLSVLLLVNMASGKHCRTLQEHYIFSGESKDTADGMMIVDSSKEFLSEINWISEKLDTTKVIKEVKNYAPRYGVKRQGNLIHRISNMENNSMTTATLILLKEGMDIESHFESDGDQISIIKNSAKTIIDIQKYIKES